MLQDGHWLDYSVLLFSKQREIQSYLIHQLTPLYSSLLKTFQPIHDPIQSSRTHLNLMWHQLSLLNQLIGNNSKFLPKLVVGRYTLYEIPVLDRSLAKYAVA